MSQQPVDLYPNNNPTNTQPDYSSSTYSSSSSTPHSNGSFGPVFVVLAIIVVISAVACVLGRFCSKKLHRGKEEKSHSNKNKKKDNNNSKGQKETHHGLGPKEWESRQKPANFDISNDGDIEFGFGKNKKSSKGGSGGGGGGGGGKMKQQPYINYQNPVSGGHHFKQDPMRYADNV